MSVKSVKSVEKEDIGIEDIGIEDIGKEDIGIGIEGIGLNYKMKGDEYIITHITDYNKGLDNYINIIFRIIIAHYATKKKELKYDNVSGENAAFICSKLSSISKLILSHIS